MSEEKLKKLIERLDEELESTEITGDETRQKLLQLMTDVKAKLNNVKSKEERQTVTKDINQAALKFEVSHPKITKTLNEISNLLSNIGI